MHRAVLPAPVALPATVPQLAKHRSHVGPPANPQTGGNVRPLNDSALRPGSRTSNWGTSPLQVLVPVRPLEPLSQAPQALGLVAGAVSLSASLVKLWMANPLGAVAPRSSAPFASIRADFKRLRPTLGFIRGHPRAVQRIRTSPAAPFRGQNRLPTQGQSASQYTSRRPVLSTAWLDSAYLPLFRAVDTFTLSKGECHHMDMTGLEPATSRSLRGRSAN